MKTFVLSALFAVSFSLMVTGSALAQEQYFAKLTGYEEAPPVSTPADGDLTLTISPDSTSISFTLHYRNLTSAAQAAHVHFGRPAINGGVSFFFCGGGGKPACPAAGTVTGTVVAADVVGPAAQNIAAGEFAKVLLAIRHRATYANLHTTNFPNGEIRGEVK